MSLPSFACPALPVCVRPLLSLSPPPPPRRPSLCATTCGSDSAALAQHVPILRAITPRGQVSFAQLFVSDEDVDIPLDNRKKAEVMMTLPEDAGPKGEVRWREETGFSSRAALAINCPESNLHTVPFRATQVLKLLLKIWVSFEPNPQFGDGFERGKTVSVTQAVSSAIALVQCAVRSVAFGIAREESLTLSLLSSPIAAVFLCIQEGKQPVHA